MLKRHCPVFNYYKIAECQRKIHQVRFQQNAQIEFFGWTPGKSKKIPELAAFSQKA
jgi:hypothetical protein